MRGDAVRRLLLLAVPVLVLVGCGAASDATKASAAAIAESFHTIRVEGKSWTDVQWDARLRQFAAEASQVSEWVQTGAIEEGAAMRHRAEARARE